MWWNFDKIKVNLGVLKARISERAITSITAGPVIRGPPALTAPRLARHSATQLLAIGDFIGGRFLLLAPVPDEPDSAGEFVYGGPSLPPACCAVEGCLAMDPRNPATLWLEPFFDVSKPYLYVLILPPLILFALGFRRFAVLFFFGAAALLAFLGAT